jgi:hypothetical protein
VATALSHPERGGFDGSLSSNNARFHHQTGVAVIAGILIASWIVGQGDGSGSSNVAVGYMVSHGLAKSGSRDTYWSDGSDIPGMKDDADAPLTGARD